MSDVRQIDLPEKDRPLRADVSLLGSLVGEMLVDQHGPELLERVERVRRTAIVQREKGDGAEGAGENALEALLADLGPEEVGRVIQAFTAYLRAVNLAEKVHRIRRRRAYERAGSKPQRGSLEAVLGELRAQGRESGALVGAVNALRIQPVFTAHPTEATRRTIQEKEYDMLLRLVERLNPELTPHEEDQALRRIRSAMTSAWQTRLVPHERPTVADELDNILFYLTNILYRVVPAFYEAFRRAYGQHWGDAPAQLLSGVILRFGSWVGGDMDGNPNVTAATIRETLARQRAVIVGRYLPDLRRARRYLSQCESEIGISEALYRRLDDYAQRMPAVAAAIPERHRDMPYRGLLRFMAARLSATLGNEAHGYGSPQAFIADIERIRDSLVANKGRHAGLFSIERLLCRARTFGFHLVTLDVRQDALLHRRVMGELLGCRDWESREPSNRAATLAQLIAGSALPEAAADDSLSAEARETLAVFRAIDAAREQFGAPAVGLFIISMSQGADDVLTALALAEIASPGSGAAGRLEVAPLLETVDDLAAGPDIVAALLAEPVYRRHLDAHGARQVVMVGYSDSSKDSGIVASRWALQEAQRRLVELGSEHGVELVFFHGRGGTVSRGGGNLVQGILGAPPGTVNSYLRLTEQGEVINQKYGVRFLALRNLELVTGAALKHSLDSDATAFDRGEEEILSFMARVSRGAFRSLVYEEPDFPDYFRSSTPLDVIERLNIGSRPAARGSGTGIDNLRAIPWVFSWAQVRVGFPGVYGFGTALDQAMARFGAARLRELLEHRLFFRAMVGDVEMVLAKSELELGRRYSMLAAPALRRHFDTIEAEFERARRQLLELKELDRLLDDQPVLQRNIRLRNPYVDPLHLLQIDLLQRWRDGERKDDGLLDALKASVNGIALGIQNTG